MSYCLVRQKIFPEYIKIIGEGKNYKISEVFCFNTFFLKLELQFTEATIFELSQIKIHKKLIFVQIRGRTGRCIYCIFWIFHCI